MAKTRFILKEPKSKNETLILLVRDVGGRRFKYSTGKSIQPRQWNPTTRTVRKGHPAQMPLNKFLGELALMVENTISEHKQNNPKALIDNLRTVLDKRLLRNQDNDDTSFWGAYDKFLESSNYKTNTVKKFITLRKHLKQFELKYYKVDFTDINLDFHDQFKLYLFDEQNLKDNATYKYIAALKRYMKWARLRRLHNNTDYEQFSLHYKAADIVTLSQSELESLRLLSLDKGVHREIRDLFIFQCLTGLRFSDISLVDKTKVREVMGESCLVIKTTKTLETVSIPLLPAAKEILTKYNYRLPSYSNPHINRELKKICQLAGIDKSITRTRHQNGKTIEEILPKYALVTNHTARRTFITQALERGMRPEVVMKISGHRTWSSFQKYVKITEDIAIVEMQKAWSKMPLTAV